MHTLTVASVMLAVAAPAHHHRPGCSKLYAPQVTERTARRIYRGTHNPSIRQVRLLGLEEQCQRHRPDQPKVRAYDRRQAQLNWARRNPQQPALASFYDDAGATASGWHAYYGVADCGSGGGPCYPFGTQIEFCYPYRSGNCVTATTDDHGPYVAGRWFDLNQNTAAALGFSGVDTVGFVVK